MPGINELKLTAKPVGETPDFDTLQPERGGWTPPPQPGSYRFAFPKVVNNFDTVKTDDYGERVKVIFDAEFPLIIVQSPNGTDHTGETYQTTLTNVPRLRSKKDQLYVSDMDYLLKAKEEVLKQKGTALPAPKQRTNLSYLKALASLAGEQFGADQEFSYSCNPRRAARWRLEDGSLGTQPDEASTLEGDDAGLKAGCGQRYYQNDIEKVDGQYPLEITCSNPECGAVVRAFGNLRRFTP